MELEKCPCGRDFIVGNHEGNILICEKHHANVLQGNEWVRVPLDKDAKKMLKENFGSGTVEELCKGPSESGFSISGKVDKVA